MFSLFLGLNNVSYPFVEIKASHTLRDRVGGGGGVWAFKSVPVTQKYPPEGCCCVCMTLQSCHRGRERERERWRDETNRSGARRESLERDLEEGEGKWTRESCPGRTKSLIVGSS